MIIEYQEHTSTWQFESKIKCDKCGAIASIDNDDPVEWQEFVRIGFCPGFGSVFGDHGQSMRVDFCQHCAMDILGPYLREECNNTGNVSRAKCIKCGQSDCTCHSTSPGNKQSTEIKENP